MPIFTHNLDTFRLLFCPQLLSDLVSSLGPLPNKPHLEIGIILARALPLPGWKPTGAIPIPARELLVRGINLGLGLGHGRRRLAAKNGEPSRGIGFLHALLSCVLGGRGGCFVAPHAGDVVRIVDVPAFLA